MRRALAAFVSAAAVGALGGCSSFSKPAPSDVAALASLRNREYRPHCAEETAFRHRVLVTDGKYDAAKVLKDPDAALVFEVVDVTRGTLSSPRGKLPVALVSTRCQVGGQSAFTELFVFELGEGEPKLVTSLVSNPQGLVDRSLKKAGVRAGRIEVEVFVRDGGDPECCASKAEKQAYQLKAESLVPVGAPKPVPAGKPATEKR